MRLNLTFNYRMEGRRKEGQAVFCCVWMCVSYLDDDDLRRPFVVCLLSACCLPVLVHVLHIVTILVD